MLALRAAANAFVHDGPREAVLTLRHEVRGGGAVFRVPMPASPDTIPCPRCAGQVLDLVKGGLRIAHKTVVHAAGVVLQKCEPAPYSHKLSTPLLTACLPPCSLALAVHRKCGSASAEPWVAETMQPLVAQAVRVRGATATLVHPVSQP